MKGLEQDLKLLKPPSGGLGAQHQEVWSELEFGVLKVRRSITLSTLGTFHLIFRLFQIKQYTKFNLATCY